MRILAIPVLLCYMNMQSMAQTSPQASQLVAAENYFVALAREKGLRKAFLTVSDENTLLFRPGPVKAVDFMKDQPKNDNGFLTWEPVYARISKSNDWGFTTGPYMFQPVEADKRASYGQYLSIWKRNDKGVWKLALDLGMNHKKPVNKPKLLFVSPKTDKFLHQQSDKRLQQREDIVESTDKLYATILKAENQVAFSEFFSDDIRLLFPGNEPIIGKKAATDFWVKQGARLSSEVTAADRCYSGELAYTYGKATVRKPGESKNYHYVRIWEIQPGFNWNIILEVYTEEGK